MNKTCLKCKQTKDRSDFHLKYDASDGLHPYCKDCRSELSKQYRKDKPWCRWWVGAYQRCTNPKHRSFYRYGGRGIKFYLTMEDLETLWYRDGAWKLNKPSLDRIDNDGDYKFSNCRFIELRDNILRRGK